MTPDFLSRRSARSTSTSFVALLGLIGSTACAQTPGTTAASAATPSAATASSASAASASCPPTASPFRLDVDHLDGYRVFVGPDGDSAVEPLRIDARTFTIPSNGQSIGIFDFPKATQRGVQVVAGPANMELAPHPTPYPEMFVLLSGSFTFRTKTFTAEMRPGSVLMFDDMGATTGHGGTIGPCGYVSLSIAP